MVCGIIPNLIPDVSSHPKPDFFPVDDEIHDSRAKAKTRSPSSEFTMVLLDLTSGTTCTVGTKRSGCHSFRRCLPKNVCRGPIPASHGKSSGKSASNVRGWAQLLAMSEHCTVLDPSARPTFAFSMMRHSNPSFTVRSVVYQSGVDQARSALPHDSGRPLSCLALHITGPQHRELKPHPRSMS